MKTFNILRLLIIGFVVFSLTSCNKSDEKEISEQEVPQTIIYAFNNNFPNAIVNKYSVEIEDGQKFYEISFELNGRKMDVLYDTAAKMCELEETIPTEELPANISDAIAAEFDDFTIKLAEKCDKKGQKFYEVKLVNKKDMKKYELLYSESGKLVEKEVMKNEKE